MHRHAVFWQFLPLAVAEVVRTRSVDPIADYVQFPEAVDCGGHYARTCAGCPQMMGDSWCNGQCTWVFSECEFTTFWVRFKRHWNDFTDWCWNLVGEFLDWVWDLEWHLALLWGPWVLLLGVGMLAYSITYKQRVVDAFPSLIVDRSPDYDSWRHREMTVLDSLKDPRTCLWSFLCTPVLAAKNYHVGKVCNFWFSCPIIFLMYTPLFCVAAVLRAWFATKLQRNLRYKPNCIEEISMSFCCICCAVGRESIEVDAAEHMLVSCPFETESTLVLDVVDNVVSAPRSLWHRMFGSSEDREESERSSWFGHDRDSHRSCWGGSHSRSCFGS